MVAPAAAPFGIFAAVYHLVATMGRVVRALRWARGSDRFPAITAVTTATVGTRHCCFLC